MSLHPHLIALSERIRDHLLSQQARAYEGRCRYRTESGRTCAIGSQIDDDYRPEFDSRLVDAFDEPVCLLADDPEIVYCVRRSAHRLGLPLLPADAPDELLKVLLRGWQLYHDDQLHIGCGTSICYLDWLQHRAADAVAPEAAHTYLLDHVPGQQHHCAGVRRVVHRHRPQRGTAAPSGAALPPADAPIPPPHHRRHTPAADHRSRQLAAGGLIAPSHPGPAQERVSHAPATQEPAASLAHRCRSAERCARRSVFLALSARGGICAECPVIPTVGLHLVIDQVDWQA